MEEKEPIEDQELKRKEEEARRNTIVGQCEEAQKAFDQLVDGVLDDLCKGAKKIGFSTTKDKMSGIIHIIIQISIILMMLYTIWHLVTIK